MRTLNDEDAALLQAELSAVELRLSADEVELRNLDLLAAHQGENLLVEELDVDGLYCLDVVIAILVARCQLAVHEIVVDGEGHGRYAVECQLDREAFAERSLTA